VDLVWVLVSHRGILDHGGHGRRVRAVARRCGRDGASRGLVLLVAHLERAFGVAEESVERKEPGWREKKPNGTRACSST